MNINDKDIDERLIIIGKQFLPFEQALELKKLGFNDPTYGYYRDRDKHLFNMSYYDEDFDDLTRAITYHQAFEFFREKHGLTAYPVFNLYKTWEYIIQKVDPTLLLAGHSTLHVCKADTFNDAELEGIKTLIKIVNKTKDVD